MNKSNYFAACLFVLLTAALGAEPLSTIITAKSAILMDAETGTILFQKNPDELIPPASLTKLMTIHLTCKAIESGQIHLEDIVPVSERAWALSQPWGSSLMFIEPRQTVTLSELLHGLAIVSGNDAAIAIAEYVGGSVEHFVEMMNEEARNLGRDEFIFVDPAGIKGENMISALGFARFCRQYIKNHPENLSILHSQKNYTYPNRKNYPDYPWLKFTSIYQENKNMLLWNYPGADGLKTGYIEESGFNLAATAERDGMRLIAVLLGIRNSHGISGMVLREQQTTALLDYGFEYWHTYQPVIPPLESIPVWFGNKKKVNPVLPQTITLTIPRGMEDVLVYHVIPSSPEMKAPVKKGEVIGKMIISMGESTVLETPLLAGEEVEQGSWFSRLTDSISLFFSHLFGGRKETAA